MDVKKIALLVGALFIAAATAIMARSMLSAPPAPRVAAAAPQPTGPEVLVATKALPVGTILGPDAVRFKPWPQNMVDGAYYVRGQATADPAKMIGMVVRAGITAGQPVTQGALVSPKDRGFLAAALTPGMRAVSIAVGGASAVAGFVFPGDHVDLVLTQTVQGADSGQPLQASETVVRNIRVLATDQRFDNQPSPEGKAVISSISMVTLEATPKMAEQIAVAQKLGSLSLSLRPLADSDRDLAQDIAAASGRSAAADPASRPEAGAGSFTTGGEVSRFSRATLPRLGGMGAAPAGGPASPAIGPVVRVARGNNVTDMPVGGQ